MNAWEQRLRAELRSESELITPDSLRPLNLHRPDGQFSARPLPVTDHVGPGRGARRHVWLAPIAAAVAVAVIAAVAGIVPHRAPRTGQEPGGAALPTAGYLRGIDALSAGDAWAVGSLDIGRTRWSNLTDEPLIVHWDGSKWRRVPVPAVPGDGKLNSIAGTSADDLWAVGVWGNGLHPIRPMIMHWNGLRWSLERFADATQAGALNGVAAASPTDAWAVGQTGGPRPGSLILHWNGSTWKQVPAPHSASDENLLSVTAISADDAWATGARDPGLQLLHWNGAAWTRQRGPDLPETVVLLGVVADSAGTVWAVGFTDGQQQAALILRRTGAAWHPVPGPKGGAGDTLAAVAVASPHSVWAAGVGPLGQDTAILHWNGTSWSQLTSAGSKFRGGVMGLAAVSADDIWAVGFRGTLAAGVPQILHWNGRSWTRKYGPATTGRLLENNSGGPYPVSGPRSPRSRTR